MSLKQVEYGLRCLPCSYTNDVIDLSSEQLCRHVDVKVTSSGPHSAKSLSKAFDNSVVAMVTDPYDVIGVEAGQTV